MPRPKFNPTTEQRLLVKSLAGVGIKHEDIARKVGVRSPKTLRKHFRAELDEGATDANYNIAQALFHKAKSGNVAAQIFWLKSRAGWRDQPASPFASVAPPPFIVAQEQGAQL